MHLLVAILLQFPLVSGLSRFDEVHQERLAVVLKNCSSDSLAYLGHELANLRVYVVVIVTDVNFEQLLAHRELRVRRTLEQSDLLETLDQVDSILVPVLRLARHIGGQLELSRSRNLFLGQHVIDQVRCFLVKTSFVLDLLLFSFGEQGESHAKNLHLFFDVWSQSPVYLHFQAFDHLAQRLQDCLILLVLLEGLVVKAADGQLDHAGDLALVGNLGSLLLLELGERVC